MAYRLKNEDFKEPLDFGSLLNCLLFAKLLYFQAPEDVDAIYNTMFCKSAFIICFCGSCLP